jgi:membrane-bound lytic murein transglycosylase B
MSSGVFSVPHVRGALGVAVIVPLILVGAASASAPSPSAPVRDAAVTPLAAVAPSADSDSGVSVVAITKTPTPFHVAAASVSAPPPAVVVNSPGGLRIPAIALNAYRNAERMMSAAAPGCGVSWNLLAGIGRIESLHAYGGATDARGTAVNPILGPALDGTLPGNEIIVQSAHSGRVVYARAMGPMQFLPGTWARYASDGDGDGKADVQNVYDASLAAARYLCSGGLSLRDSSQVTTAILRYNNSVAYARNVLGWAAAYATGVMPVDLPPITGPVPPIGDQHLDANPEGLGPGLPLNAMGLPANDPLALVPLLARADASQLPTTNLPGLAPGQSLGPLPGPAPQAPPAPLPAAGAQPGMPPAQQPTCAVFCLGPQAAPPAPGPLPPQAPPPGPLPPQAPPPGPAEAPPAAPLPAPPAAPLPAPEPAPAEPIPPMGPLPVPLT